MSNFYGANAQKLINVPSERLDVSEQHGRVRRAYDSITFAAELTTSDSLKLMKLPANARIVDCRLISPDLGTTGVIDVGWEAGASGAEVADPNGLFAAQDVKTAAVDAKMGGTLPGYNKKFSEEVQIAIVPSENTNAATGLKLELEIFYVVD